MEPPPTCALRLAVTAQPETSVPSHLIEPVISDGPELLVALVVPDPLPDPLLVPLLVHPPAPLPVLADVVEIPDSSAWEISPVPSIGVFSHPSPMAAIIPIKPLSSIHVRMCFISLLLGRILVRKDIVTFFANCLGTSDPM